MANIKRVTSFTHHRTGEGDRLSYASSEIDTEGNLVKSNERATCIVMDAEVLAHIDAINAFIQNKLA